MFNMNTGDEESYILVGDLYGPAWVTSAISYELGIPARVGFNHELVRRDPDRVIGWIHTHPSMIASPSATDISTMNAWVVAEGRPFVCCIQGADGLRCFWFFDDEQPFVEGYVRMVKKRIVGVMPRVVRPIMKRAKKWPRNLHTKSPTVEKV